MATIPKQNKTQKHPKPAPFDLGASDLSVITKKLVSDRRKSIIKTHLKPYWNEHVKGSVRGRCEFSGTIREYFWCSDFIPQILEDAIYEILQQTAETCPKDNLKWYVKEAGILLQLGLVNRVYDYMVHIDQHLRSKGGNLKSVKRVEVYDDKVPKMRKLVEQYVTAVSLKAVSPKETTTAETGQNIAPAKRQRTKRIIGWIFKGFIALTLLLICLYVFGVVTGIFIFASVLTCLHLLGYLEQFNTLIDKILQLK